MWLKVIEAGVFVVLALAVLPTGRVRQVVLTLLHRGLQLAVLAAVVAGAVFCLVPQSVPTSVETFVGPWQGWLAAQTGLTRPDWIWIAAVSMLLAVCVPVLAGLDFACRLGTYGSTIRRLMRVLREMNILPPGTYESETARPPVPSDDVQTASRTMTSLVSRTKPSKGKLADLLGA